MASKDAMELAFDIIGLLVSGLMTYFPTLTMILIVVKIIVKEFLVFSKKQDESDSAEMNYWYLASLLARFLGPFLILIVSIVLLVRLMRYYPITQDVFMTRFIIGFGCIGCLSMLLTDMMCYKTSTTLLEVLLIYLTICTHTLRFASQGPLGQFEAIPVIVLLIGVIPGVLCLIPLEEKFLPHLLHHLAFKIATLAAATFRLTDAVVICFHTTRERANYFRSRLQECFR